MVHKVAGGYKITDREHETMKRNAKIVAGIKGRKHTAGRASLTRPGDADFTSKRKDKDHHIKHHDVKEKRAPYAKKK